MNQDIWFRNVEHLLSCIYRIYLLKSEIYSTKQ